MSQSIPTVADCCVPCEDPLVENIPGPQGEPGADGIDGVDGQNAFTTLTNSFVQPAIGANVTIVVGNSEWAAIGQDIVSESGGYYLVIARPSATSLTIQNRGYSANAAPGVTIPNGSTISPAGEKGEAGADGSDVSVPLTTKGDILGYDSAPARVPVGSDGKVLAADSAQGLGVAWNTVQPNTATDNAIARYNGTSGKPVPLQDSYVVITDDGALQASGSGGNARGARAVDLQVVRSAATAVASGTESVVSGGLNNTASAANSTVGGGATNVASDQYATVAGGASNRSTGFASSVGGGNSNEVTADMATIPGGREAIADLYGQMAHASGGFGAAPTAQTSELLWRADTTDATPTELFLDGSSERAVVRNVHSYYFKIIIVARVNGAANNTDTAAWECVGVIKRVALVTSLVGSVTTTLLVADAGAVADAWGLVGNVAVTADDTNESLKIMVTGAADRGIRWVAHARLVEVGYATVP